MIFLGIMRCCYSQEKVDKKPVCKFPNLLIIETARLLLFYRTFKYFSGVASDLNGVVTWIA